MKKAIKTILCVLAIAILLPTVKYSGAFEIVTDNTLPVSMFYSGYHDEQSKTFVMQTPQELRLYCKTYAKKYGFLVGAADTEKSAENNFGKLIGKYNESWFENHTLVVFVSDAGSSSIRYRYKGVEYSSDFAEITLAVKAPAQVNCDMAGWHTFIELEKRPVLRYAKVVFQNE